MLLKKIAFVFFISPAYLFSQFVDSSDDRYKAYYYDNGLIASEGFLEKGKPNGYWITYYPNQLRKSEGNRLNFELEGTWKFYNEKGNIETRYQTRSSIL